MSRHMGDYRRMVRVEQPLVYATPTTPLVYHQSNDLWTSPRGTVLRIQALALVAIILSFFLAIFGSCRRWSNRWIVQKGFLAAQVLSLSLGTYSIGLMQSSSVKSELYPVWAVSLLTLLGCIDPVTTYIGLDYKGPLLKVIFQLCLYSGYILLMSASTISSLFGNVAIVVLSVITFIKGFHRSLALVLPSIMRNKLRELNEPTECNALLNLEEGVGGQDLVVHIPVRCSEEKRDDSNIKMSDIRQSCQKMKDEKFSTTIKKVCLGYSLSHLLRRRFLGMNTASQMEERRKTFTEHLKSPGNYKKILEAVEVELAFLYEIFFTSNEFLHYYEAKTSSFWALASFVGICLVGIAAAIPGTMASRYYHRNSTYYYTAGPGAATSVVVNTTTADIVITLVILVSMALLQLVQLMGCWTSNWAKVNFACEYAKNRNEQSSSNSAGNKKQMSRRLWMTMKAFVVSSNMNWLGTYLWQDKLGQYSAVAAVRSWREEGCMGCLPIDLQTTSAEPQQLPSSFRGACASKFDQFTEMLGMQYIKQALEELLWSSSGTKGGAGVRLHDDVKKSIHNFLHQMKSPQILDKRSPLFDAGNTLHDLLDYHPCTSDDKKNKNDKSETYMFTFRVMVWHIATWYCQEAEESGQGSGSDGDSGGCCCRSRSRENSNTDDSNINNRRVAIALSRYCAYLVVSAPELLPGPAAETKRAFDRAASQTSEVARCERVGLSAIIREASIHCNEEMITNDALWKNDAFWKGVNCGKRLLKQKAEGGGGGGDTRTCDHWKVLADLWVQTLLYAAPYGDVEAHMQHLSQGGEFITHLWALLYHLGIVDGWGTDTAHDVGAEAGHRQTTTPGTGSSKSRGNQRK